MSAARVCKEQSDYVKCRSVNRDSCSSPQQSRLSRCLHTCCRLLGACEWVALRPRLRCLLLLEDGRLASEHCPLLCRLNLVVIEWHERMMPAHRGETNRLTRLMESPSCRLPVVPWH